MGSQWLPRILSSATRAWFVCSLPPQSPSFCYPVVRRRLSKYVYDRQCTVARLYQHGSIPSLRFTRHECPGKKEIKSTIINNIILYDIYRKSRATVVNILGGTRKTDTIVTRTRIDMIRMVDDPQSENATPKQKRGHTKTNHCTPSNKNYTFHILLQNMCFAKIPSFCASSYHVRSGEDEQGAQLSLCVSTPCKEKKKTTTVKAPEPLRRFILQQYCIR